MNLIFFAVFAACACFVNGHKFFNYWPQIVIIKPMANRPPFYALGSLLPNANLFKPPHVPSVKNVRPSTFTTFSTAAHHTFNTYRPEKTMNTIPTQLPEPEAREHENDDEINDHEKDDEIDDHENDDEIDENEAENIVTEPETEASTGSPVNESIPESPDTEVSAETEHNTTESNSCTTPSGGSGECVSVYNCQVLLDLVNKKAHTSQDIDLLKKSQCGYQGSSPAVCCPKQTQQPQGNCYTPEGKVGQCISLYSCTHLANMLKPPVPQENIAYVQSSKCQGSEQYSVCCGPPPDRDQNVVPSGNCKTQMSAFPPDPRTECCGVDGRVGNKIVGGTATTVDQYPWLTLIEYVQAGVTKLLCGGVLISGKYVLTAGHCVVGQVLNYGTPKRVRLAEYDTSHDGPDCAAVEAGGEDCTEGVTRILIEKITPHPQYNPVSSLKRNDIALLRLKEMAPFTDFIRPICLPTKDLTVPPNIPENFTMYAAGWGAVSDRKSFSAVKLHVDLPYVAPEKCQTAYSLPGRSVTLGNAQMCAGGVTGKDSCKGDSGGPLMYEDGRTYEVIGIVSFGPIPCGLDGVPGVYSKVYSYLDWIRSTIVP